MHRRDLLKMIAAATGTACIGSYALAYIQVPKVTVEQSGFSADDVAYMNEIGEVIIPQTTTPGAKQANVGATMAILVADCYSKEQKASFSQGLEQINQLANSSYSLPFVALNKDQQLNIIETVDNDAKALNRQSEPAMGGDGAAPPHPFTLIKQLVLFSFFTSELGATKVLRHVPIPGAYDGDFLYKKGDRAWS